MMDLRKVGEGPWRHLALMTALLLFFLAGEFVRSVARGNEAGKGSSGWWVGRREALARVDLEGHCN